MPLFRVENFPIRQEHVLSVIGLQGDSAIHRTISPEGALFQPQSPATAWNLCHLALDVSTAEGPDLIILPELSLPVASVDEALASLPEDTLLLAGLESMHPAAYAALRARFSDTLDIEPGSGSYVNALLVAVRSGHRTTAAVRAKRVASGVENQYVNFCQGSELILVELGQQPVRILPLICAEFQHALWAQLPADIAAAPIDMVVVLQLNSDPEQLYPSAALTTAYTHGQPVGSARFLLANNAVGEHCDGSTYLIYPPGSLHLPEFDCSRTELWHVPHAAGYSGFRVPDRSGCVWKMTLRLPGTPTDAYQALPCSGSVIRVWRPIDAANQGGLAMGLMRTSVGTIASSLAHRGTNVRIREHLDPAHDRFLLGDLTRESAQASLYWATISSSPEWSTVEQITSDIVESCALLGAGGSASRIQGHSSNCVVNGRNVVLLHAPSEIDALAGRFQMEYCIPPHSAPSGVVTFGVTVAALAPDTRIVGERIRADLVMRNDPNLQGMPAQTDDSSVNLAVLNFHCCELEQLRGLYNLVDGAAATYLTTLLPGVFQ